MSEEKTKIITTVELKTYLNSLEKEQEKEKSKEIHEYKLQCNMSGSKIKKREIARIEKEINKEYINIIKTKNELLSLLDECKGIPEEIEILKITEYMLYRVDLRKAEKIINKATKKLEKIYSEIQEDIYLRIVKIPAFDNIETIDYGEFKPKENDLAKSKEQYKLEYTEEQRKELIKRDLEIIEQVKTFNTVPIPHEILKNSDRDIQSKMQRFNSIRQKRIKILETMKSDYEKLIDPREVLAIIQDAFVSLEKCKDILTRAEYTSVKRILNKRKRKITKSTNDINSVIETKEKKTGITSFNIQQARYLRMENLRNIITTATTLIKENPIEGSEEQLEKLKISYQREKQFASVIQNLNDGKIRK